MTVRHFYVFPKTETSAPSIGVLTAFQKAVEHRFRFDKTKVIVTVLSGTNTHDVRIETLAEDERLNPILEYVSGYLDALENVLTSK